MCAVHLTTCATGWSSIFHFWELTGFITVSAVSFQFTNISSQFGDSCLYVGNSGRQCRICTWEYFASLLLHKQLEGTSYNAHTFPKATKLSTWYTTDTNQLIYGITLLSQVVPDTNHLVTFGKICWELFELSLLQTEKHTNWRNRPRHRCRMVWLKCYAYFNNI